ncbi:hypothetical protein E3N88_29668 [Mikania micrantha]|uniref:Aminotransferase-like plant mobile domain-containing protein n=1 Tax=Mikania micrantha TaxID=192012 RepID=A0A5N6MJI1_9ASTR|nr:hypothetical protein E3N88_29668 [Mikania micrantha]
MSYDLHPSPIVDDLLFLKDSHWAHDIFNNEELTKLVFRGADQKFFSLLKSNTITDNVKRYIDIAGFGGVIDSGYRIFVKQHRAIPATLADHCIYCSCRHGVELLLLHRRFYIDLITEDHMFKWRPYEEVIGFLPGICMSGIRSWQSECFLIYWDVVKFHTPQRVMRQFGMVQRIPDPIPLSFNEHMKLHSISRSGKPEKKWRNIHSQFLSVWNQRWENVVRGVRCAEPTVEPSYMQWCWSRTVLYITNSKLEEVMQPGFQDHSPNDAYGFSGISPLPSLDLNLQMSVGDLDDDTFLANTLNAEDVDVDQNPIASRRKNPHRHRKRPDCGT